MNSPKKKSPAPSAPDFMAKSQWPHGSTYVPQTETFEEFAKANFVPGTSMKFVRKELKKPILVYTPEKERNDVIKVWRILIRYMGDIVDYRRNMDHDTHQPELGSVMTRLCRQLGQDVSQNPFGPSPAKPGELNLNDDDLQMLPNKPKLGTLRKLKNTIALRLFGKGRKSVFQFLPLEETLLSDLDKIQYIIGYGILRPRIRDELYCGLCRQLTGNPYKESVDKGWVMMNLMAASFAPSQRCFNSIIQFLEAGPKIYAASAKRLLQKTAVIGERLHPPSRPEYLAVLKKVPFELDIHLMDGKSISLPADGTTSSFEISSAVSNKLGMHSCFGFHIYITNRTKISSLGGNDHILDSVSQLEQISRDYTLSEEDSAWTLYLRKEVFEPWEDFTSDSVTTNLIYEQLKRGVLLQEYHFQNEDDLSEFLAKVCYIEKGVTLDDEYLQEEIIPNVYWHVVQPNHNEEDEQEELDESVVHELTEKIKHAFENLYTATESKPNTFNVKLELIATARKQWADVFSHSFDITVVIDNGEILEGVAKICVHSTGITLQGEDEMPVDNIAFVEVMQLAEEINDEEIHPHSIVFKLLDGRDLICVTQDAADIRDMVSHLLLGLTDRSKYAVAITQNTSSKVDDLDLETGDLLILDRWNKETEDTDIPTLKAKNMRTGQVGIVNDSMFHILPTLEQPDEHVMQSYKERSNWLAE